MSESAFSPVPASKSKARVLSGMRPTGKLHLGNYMGALHNWVKLQHQYESFFFIADWHALTTDYSTPGQIKQSTLDVALEFLAAGLDVEQCMVFIQSHVRQHAELHLLLSMMTPLSWLERVPTYKDQIDNLKNKDLTTYGFLGYPLLQTADILLYGAPDQPLYVPVGQDQVAHIEITREVARRFNSLYRANVFAEPEALLTPTPKLPGIDGRKMSKSYGNTIGLTESPVTAAAKLASMSTNGQRVSQSEPGDPDLCPVGDLHKIFSSVDVIAETQGGCRTATIPCAVCKSKVADAVIGVIEPIHAKRLQLESDIENTWDMLVAQSEKAIRVAEETMGPVREALNITHDLGALKQRFSAGGTEQPDARNLRGSAILELEGAERAKALREYWQKSILPYDIPLTMEAHKKFASVERELEEPLLTAKKKRVWVGTAGSAGVGRYEFAIPAKSYEVWTLLFTDGAGKLEDLVIPQKYFSAGVAAAKKAAENPKKLEFIGATVSAEANRLILQIGSDATPIEITELGRNYDPLR